MNGVPGKHEALKILNNRIKACKWYPVCPIRRLFEAGKLDKKWIEWYCKGDWKRCVRYQMEENGQFHPDNMLPDGRIL